MRRVGLHHGCTQLDRLRRPSRKRHRRDRIAADGARVPQRREPTSLGPLGLLDHLLDAGARDREPEIGDLLRHEGPALAFPVGESFFHSRSRGGAVRQ